MALTVEQFRESFPMFSRDTYADSRVQFWLGVAVLKLPEARWGTLYDHGQGLFTAHNLTLERQASAGDNVGAPGLVSSKTVGPVSKSYSQQDVTHAGAGNYNLTYWGREFWSLSQMIGAGGLLV